MPDDDILCSAISSTGRKKSDTAAARYSTAAVARGLRGQRDGKGEETSGGSWGGGSSVLQEAGQLLQKVSIVEEGGKWYEQQ